jgi:hypothetical protein
LIQILPKAARDEELVDLLQTRRDGYRLDDYFYWVCNPFGNSFGNARFGVELVCYVEKINLGFS